MVSIIILSYNTKELLKNCLTSVLRYANDVSYQVIVVDNASSDGSPEMVAKEFSQVKLIKNKTNVGFAKGNNIGVEQATHKYVLFLNSDTLLRDNSIKGMTEILEKDDTVAVVGGKLENSDGSTSKSFGSFYGIWDVIKMLFGNDRQQTSHPQTTQHVDWVSGGFMLIRTDVFRKLNGFDEHFFMYIEDMELCYRINKLKYGIMFYPEAKVLHKAQGSSNRSFAIIHIYKGLVYFYKKHKSYGEYLLLKLVLVLKACLAIIMGTLMNKGDLKETYRKALIEVI